MDKKVEVVSDQVPLIAMALLVGMFGICTEHSTVFTGRLTSHKPQERGSERQDTPTLHILEGPTGPQARFSRWAAHAHNN